MRPRRLVPFSSTLRRQLVEPRHIPHQLAPANKVTGGYKLRGPLIPIGKVHQPRIPQLPQHRRPDRLCAPPVLGGRLRLAGQLGEARNGQCIRILVAVDRRPKRIPSRKPVAILIGARLLREPRTRRIDRRDRVLRRIQQRLYPIKIAPPVEVVVPQVVDVLHRVQVPHPDPRIPRHPCGRLGRRCNRLREVPVVCAARVEVIDQVVDHRRVPHPAPLGQVKRCRIVQIGVRLPRPGHILQKLQHCRPLRPDLADVRAKQLPPVVVDLLNLSVVDLNKGNPAQKPRRIRSERCRRQMLPRQPRPRIGIPLPFRYPGRYRCAPDRQSRQPQRREMCDFSQALLTKT